MSDRGQVAAPPKFWWLPILIIAAPIFVIQSGIV